MLHFFDQKYSENRNIVILLQFQIKSFILFYIIYIDGKAEFLQSSVSHDPSEIILICWFGAQDTFSIIINVWNSFHFYGNIYVLFPLMNRTFKRMLHFCNKI